LQKFKDKTELQLADAKFNT